MTRIKLNQKYWLWAVIFFTTFLNQVGVTLGDGPQNTTAVGESEGKVCGTLDIRNTVDSFDKLTDCRVIEGDLRILLIDYATPKDYESLHFPKLVEITDHLVLYRVTGLTTLRHVFPNLAVIRGEELFFNYALVAFEMQSLEELGLISLVHIGRGAVRFEKNPNLCYINTIDWSKIARGVDSSDHLFSDNSAIKNCVDTCSDQCDRTATDNEEPQLRCWTSAPEDCQKMLTCPNCPSQLCNGSLCCHQSCIGGCTGHGNENCIACKDVAETAKGVVRCVEKCPRATYKYRNRRCLIASECVKQKDGEKTMKLIPPEADRVGHQGECAFECPPYYTVDRDNKNNCVKCAEKCPKVCDGGKIVDSVTAAQELKGCTIINGPLVIQIMGGSNIGPELDENLGQIEEVTHYIRITRSYALLSLSFFRNLRVIRGVNLDSDRYALKVVENLNLRELFRNETQKNLKMEKGTVFFHYNRKLCVNKIMTFLKDIGKSNITDDLVSKSTNGDQTACIEEVIHLTVTRILARIALLKWDAFDIPDTRYLYSYVINYRESEEQDATVYDGRDACSDQIWTTKDVESNGNNDTQTDFISNLKPYTQYAVYVQTYMISTAKKRAMSPIIYFRTAPSAPSSPRDVTVKAIHPGQLQISWEPPTNPYGIVSHYMVYWQYHKISAEEYDIRNYCTDPLVSKKKIEKEKEEEKKKKEEPGGKCCACPKTEKQKEKDERERLLQIMFQNYLYDAVYHKRPPDTLGANGSYARPKRDTFNYPEVLDAPKTTYPNHVNITDIKAPTKEPEEEKPAYLLAEVYNSTYIILSHLGHFEDYDIEVIACQEKDPRDISKSKKLCSSKALATGRTLKSDTADNVNTSTVSSKLLKNHTGEVFIQWTDPPAPNGLIVTYEIQYNKVNINNVKPTIICIPHKKYRVQRGFKLQKLDTGNYTFRIRATSLSGNGSWTDEKYFVITSPEESGWPKDTVIAVSLALLMLVVLVIVIVVWLVAKHRGVNKIPAGGSTSMNPEYIPFNERYVPDEWEVEREKIKVIRELGQGSFGMVYEGIAADMVPGKPEMRVAVKTMNKSSANVNAATFLKEASIMKEFDCYHVVKLLGVVSQGEPVYVVMEYMENGDLKSYLRSHRPDDEDNPDNTPPPLRQILQMAGEIADGMSYLVDRKYVHRDLAARNCMVAEDCTVKIGDFGMTRDIYENDYYRLGGRGLLPVRWMAPESLKDGVFSSMSDVWSYGVVLWEMATLAAQPYQGLSNEEVRVYVLQAKHMEMPEGCPEKLFSLMAKTWSFKPKQRPTFKEIIEFLLPDLSPSFRQNSYFFSEKNKTESLEMPEDYEDNPINDESSTPFIGDAEGATGTNDIGQVELSGALFNRKDDISCTSEPCDCIMLQETNSNLNHNNHRFSTCSSPNSGVGSSEGSKESSKSSNSSYALMNGINVANGHVPVQLRPAQC
ncbi:hypothetical protein ScPMuIL_017742 [Solemya velum]